MMYEDSDKLKKILKCHKVLILNPDQFRIHNLVVNKWLIRMIRIIMTIIDN